MSTHIENEVVSMQFDNKHFESNVRTSLGTLEKLKQSLKLHDAAKGFENVSKAAKGVDLSPLSTSIDKVGLKFNGLYTIADQVLRNIVNTVQRTANQIVSAFTIDPIKTGFSEYELKMGSIQTIMASTGEDLATVNRYLDELNQYSDETIYSFADMTTNIGKFTNAGVKLEDAVLAIKGIANVAAVSGANANEASRSMYNFAQALSAGYVKLMDWKSIELANMATVEFKTQLLEAAVAAGTLTKAADGTYKTLKGTVVTATKNFNESLADQWMTTEVLVNTLGDYADETTEIGEKASKAATEVKTFSQMMDTLKESAQSGWAQTWELIFGDFEEGKTLWTSISEVLGGIIDSSSKSRNSLLSATLDSGWEKMIATVTKAGISVSDFEEEVKRLAKNSGIDIEGMIEEYGSLEKAILECENPIDILNKAFNNLFGGWGSDSDGDGLKEYTVKAGDTLSELAEKWGTSVEEIMLLNKQITDPDMILTGWVLKIPGAIDKTGKSAEDATKYIAEFRNALAGVEEAGGRAKLIESFSNLWKVIKKITGPIGEAFREIFKPITSEQLLGAITTFHTFTEKLANSKSWDGVSKSLKDTFQGVFSLVQIIGKVIGGGLKLGWKVFSGILDGFGLSVLDFTAGIGRAITKLNEWLDAGIGKGVDWLVNAIKWLYNLPGVQKFITSFTESWVKFKEAISSRWDKGVAAFLEWIDRIKQLDGFTLDNVKAALVDFKNNVIKAFTGISFDSIVKSMKKFGSVVKSKSGEIWKNIKTWFEGFKELDGFSLDNIKKAFTSFYTKVIKPIFVKEDGTTIFDRLVSTIKNFWGSVKNWFSNIGINLDNLKNKILAFFGIEGELDVGGIWTKFINKITEIKDNLIGAFGGIIDFFVENKGKITAMAAFIGIFLLFKKFLDVVGMFGETISSLSNIGESFSKFTKSLSLSLKANAIKTVAESLAILVGAIALICFLPKDRLLPALGVLLSVAVILGGLFTVMALVSNKIGTADLTKFAVSMIAVSGALLIFGIAVKIIAGLEWEDLGKAGAILGAFVGIAALIGYIASKSRGLGNSMTGFGSMIAKFSIALLLLAGAIHIFGNMDNDVLSKGIDAVTVLLLRLVGMMWATNLLAKTGKKSSIVKMGSIAMGLGVALLAMAGAVAIFGSMDTKTLIQGGIAVSACIMLMIGMMAATDKLAKIGSGGSIVKVGSMFAGMGAALLMIAGAVAIFGNMKTSTLIKGGAAVLVFMGMFVGMMAATKLLATTGSDKQFVKVSGMILAFSASLILIAGAIAILSMINFGDLVKSTAIIGAIGLLFVALIAATKFIPEKSMGTIIALGGALFMLAGSVALLSYIDADRLKLASIALGSLIGMLTLLTVSLKGPDISLRKIISIAGLLAAVLAVISIFAAVGIASLPTIGRKMSEFMGELNSENGFISGIEKLSSIASLNPGIIEDIGTMLSAVGSLLSGAAKYAIVDALPFVDASKSLEAVVEWIEDVIDVIIDLGPKLSGVSINREALTAVLDAARILCECAAMAPTTTIALGGFVSKWGSGVGAVIDIPELKHAKDWIVSVVPVVRDLATAVAGEGVTINKTNLDNVCTAATMLAEAAAKAPSITIAGGAFSSKWVSGGAAVVDWPMLRDSKDWIVAVTPIIRELAESVSSGNAKNLDKTKLDAICTGAKTLAEAASLAPSMDVVLGLANGPWGFGLGTYITIPLIGRVADWISSVKTPMIDLADACSGGVDGISNFNADNFKAVIQGISDLCAAVEEAPSVDFGGLINVGKLGLTLAFGISHPILSSLTSFIANVKTPIVDLANACSGGVDGIKNFDSETFKAIIGGISDLCAAVEEAPSVDFGGLINVGKLGLTLAFGISHPLLSALSTFITNVKDPIIGLANACSGGTDGIKNFNETTFKTIIQAIADIANIKYPSVKVGGGFAAFAGGIAGGLGLSWPLVSATANFITNSKDAIIELANAVSGTGEGSVITNGFNKENFESIVGAISQLASVQYPTVDKVTALLGGITGFGVFGGGLTSESKADFDGMLGFISSAKDPIINLANAVSGVAGEEGKTGLTANFDKTAFESVVGAISQLAGVQYPTVDKVTALLGGIAGFGLFGAGGYLTTESKADFDGMLGFISSAKDPIINLANAVSGVAGEEGKTGLTANFDKTAFESIVDVITKLAGVQYPTVDTINATLSSISGFGEFKAGLSKESKADFDGMLGFISSAKDSIINLANAVSGVADKEGNTGLTANFDKTAFESITDAIVQLAGVQYPTIDTINTTLTGISGFGMFEGGLSKESKADFDGFVNFIAGVKQPIIDLANEVSGEDVTIDHDKITSICTAIKELATASKDIPLNSWVGRSFTGVTDFTSFTNFIAGVGPSIQTMNSGLAEVKLEDGSKIEAAANAVKILAQASKEIPTEGGFWDWDGETDWDGFKTALPAFGEGIAKFAEKVSGIQTTNLDSVSSSFHTVTQAVAIINASLGGGLSEEMINRYNETLTKLADSVVSFSGKVEGINVEATSAAAKAILDLTGSIYNFMVGTDYTKVDTATFDTKLGELGDTMSNFADKISGINSGVVSTGTANINGLIEIINKINALETISKGWSVITGFTTVIATKLQDFVDTLAPIDPTSAISKVNQLITMISGMNGVNYTGANSFPTALETVASTSISKFVGAFSAEDVVSKVTAAGASLVSNALGGAMKPETYSSFYGAGAWMTEGLAAGIGDSDAVAKVIAAAEAAVAAAIAAAEEEAGINSPAKEFIRIATYCGMGLTKGFSNYESKTYESGRRLADSAKAGLSDAISRVSDVIESGVDAQPTIRPVLDLTDVSAGASRINSLFGTPSVGVLSRVGAISTMMNGIQNGRNNDVIAAINDLGSRLGNTSGNTYNINGITYDDGSNITSAVEALVRAAIRERRA